MNPWRGLKNLPREMWILCGATLVNRSGTMVLSFLVLYITATRGVSPARAALALTVYGLSALLVMPLAGRLADRVGPLPIMKTSLFLTGVLLLIFPLAKSYVGILMMTFGFSVLNESIRPASLSMISSLVAPAQRKSAFALNRLSANLGMSIGPAIGGILAVYSFRWLFLVDGSTSILAGLVLVLAPWRNLTQIKSQEPQWEDAEDLGREIEADSTTPLAALHPTADLRAFRNRRMLYFIAALIPVQLVFFQLTSTLPLFLVHNLRFPESIYGTIFTVNTLLIVALEVPLNSAMADWSHRHTLTLGALLYAVGFGSYALVGIAPFGKTAGVFAAVVIWTFGEMIMMPGSSAYAAEIAPPERRGEYMGLYTMSFNIGFSVGPLLGASLLGRWGPSVAWGAAFVSGCISALMMSRIGTSPNKHKNANQPA
ncbi:MAG: MFS transporter, partial [Candidatus Acidiferrales bacterium]